MIASFFVAPVFVACDNADENVPEMNQVQASTPKTVPIVQVDAFTAPSSSVISSE